MERFVIIVNGFQLLTIITKRSILDVAAALDPPLKLKLRVNCSLLKLDVGKFHLEKCELIHQSEEFPLNYSFEFVHSNDILLFWDTCMLKMCREFIHKYLEYIFQDSLIDARFPSEWKKDNVAPLPEKNKTNFKNYRPVSLLPIGAKTFEKVIYNIIFEYLIRNNLIT